MEMMKTKAKTKTKEEKEMNRMLTDTQLITLALAEPNPHRRCLFRFKDKADLLSNFASTVTEPHSPKRLVCCFYTINDGNYRSFLLNSGDLDKPHPTDLIETVNHHPTYFGPKLLPFSDDSGSGFIFAQGIPPNPALVFLVALAYNEAKGIFKT